MSVRDEEQLRAIWRGQAIAPPPMTPQQLRARAAQFESSIRRRNLRDYVSFGLVATLSALGLLPGQHGGTRRRRSDDVVGAFLDVRVASIRLVEETPAESGAQTCAAHHQRHLEQQRDIVLSWPWGIGLVIPGFVLVTVELGMGFGDRSWAFPAVMIGVLMFMYIALIIYGRMLAARWQREIDSLRSLRA